MAEVLSKEVTFNVAPITYISVDDLYPRRKPTRYGPKLSYIRYKILLNEVSRQSEDLYLRMSKGKQSLLSLPATSNHMVPPSKRSHDAAFFNDFPLNLHVSPAPTPQTEKLSWNHTLENHAKAPLRRSRRLAGLETVDIIDDPLDGEEESEYEPQDDCWLDSKAVTCESSPPLLIDRLLHGKSITSVIKTIDIWVAGTKDVREPETGGTAETTTSIAPVDLTGEEDANEQRQPPVNTQRSKSTNSFLQSPTTSEGNRRWKSMTAQKEAVEQMMDSNSYTRGQQNQRPTTSTPANEPIPGIPWTRFSLRRVAAKPDDPHAVPIFPIPSNPAAPLPMTYQDVTVTWVQGAREQASLAPNANQRAWAKILKTEALAQQARQPQAQVQAQYRPQARVQTQMQAHHQLHLAQAQFRAQSSQIRAQMDQMHAQLQAEAQYQAQARVQTQYQAQQAYTRPLPQLTQVHLAQAQALIKSQVQAQASAQLQVPTQAHAPPPSQVLAHIQKSQNQNPGQRPHTFESFRPSLERKAEVQPQVSNARNALQPIFQSQMNIPSKPIHPPSAPAQRFALQSLLQGPAVASSSKLIPARLPPPRSPSPPTSQSQTSLPSPTLIQLRCEASALSKQQLQTTTFVTRHRVAEDAMRAAYQQYQVGYVITEGDGIGECVWMPWPRQRNRV
ncbi:Transcriptional activator flo8 [Agyrium rufum]|nr:Transcriptional activator flo8 [Agyrium rufum]